MLGVKVAVQTMCLAQPLRQALHTAAQLGAEGVQFDLRQELVAAELSDTGLRQLRKLLDDLNLRVASTVFPTRRGYADPDDLERRMDATVAAMRATSRLQSRVMVASLGALPGRDQPQRTTLVDAVTALAMHGNRLGVQLAFQCHAASAAEVGALLQELPDGLIGVDFSPADVILNGSRPQEFVESLGGRIVHVYANDAVRGAGVAAGSCVQLGRGAADFPELLAMLEEHGYRNWVTVERRDSSRPIDDVGNAVKFLRAL